MSEFTLIKVITLPEDSFTKTVNYFGIEYDVPVWIRWIAADADGELTGYQTRPYLLSKLWATLDSNVDLGIVEFCGNWEESLIEV